MRAVTYQGPGEVRVDEVAEVHPMAEGPPALAAVVVAAQAGGAAAAGDEEGAEHAVADGHPGHRVADRQHLADVLVADARPRVDRHAAVEDVEVGAADAARLDRDDRLVRIFEHRLGDLVDPHDPRPLVSHPPHGGKPTARSTWPAPEAGGDDRA